MFRLTLGVLFLMVAAAHAQVGPPQPFGQTPDGKKVEEYTLKNSKGMIVKLMTLGATITEISVPDKNGKTRAHVRPVLVGAMLGEQVVILKGLSSGEQVAASGSFKLREAALVAIAADSVADVRPTK